jgi:predicted metal-dependent phosphoesterase TrpH
MKIDLHIHSKYSKDSLLEPEKIISMAKKKGLGGIAVTDHNTIKGGLTANNIDKEFVIVGAELRTEYGDVVGLFLNEEIKSNTFIEVVEEIKDQDGLVVLAHPFRKGIKFPADLLQHVDAIEGFNARSPKDLNGKAKELARSFGMPTTAGSDAHLGFEIGRGRTIVNSEVKEALRTGKTKIEGEESNYYLVHGLSVAMEKMKNSIANHKITRIFTREQ